MADLSRAARWRLRAAAEFRNKLADIDQARAAAGKPSTQDELDQRRDTMAREERK